MRLILAGCVISLVGWGSAASVREPAGSWEPARRVSFNSDQDLTTLDLDVSVTAE